MVTDVSPKILQDPQWSQHPASHVAFVNNVHACVFVFVCSRLFVLEYTCPSRPSSVSPDFEAAAAATAEVLVAAPT
jgi:hypothetical protein